MSAEQYLIIAAVAFGASMVNSKDDGNRLVAFLVLVGVCMYAMVRGGLAL